MEKGAEVDCGNPKSHNQQDGPKESGAFGFFDHEKADDGTGQEDACEDGGGDPAFAQF